MIGARRAWWTLLAILVALHVAALAILGFDRPAVHDEIHFLAAIERFAEAPNLQTLRHYEEMSTPLPFMLYAGWGRVFGMHVPTLRLLSVLLALLTYRAIFSLVLLVIHRPRVALWTTLAIAANPYMLAVGVLVYTDMLMILFAVLATTALLRREACMLALWLALAMLCRQYAVTFAIGACLVPLWMHRAGEGRTARHIAIAAVASMLPLPALFGLWGGLSPDHALRERFGGTSLSYHGSSLTLYVAQCFIYLLPALIVRRRDYLPTWRNLWIITGLAFFYWVCPVRPSPAAESYGVQVVGFFDRGLHAMLSHNLPRDLVWFGCFALGAGVTGRWIAHLAHSWRLRRLEHAAILELLLLSFLAIMPLSYLHWEKYFLPMLPLGMAAILASGAAEHQRYSDTTVAGTASRE